MTYAMNIFPPHEERHERSVGSTSGLCPHTANMSPIRSNNTISNMTEARPIPPYHL